MKALRSRFVCAALVATLAASVSLVVPVPGPRGQVEAQQQNAHCEYDPQGGLYCVNCNSGPFPPATGCSQPPPGVYQLGRCKPGGVVCYEMSYWNCGFEVWCATGDPTTLLCAQEIRLCR